MKKKKNIILLSVFSVIIFSVYSVLIYNSYEAKVGEDYNTVKYNNSVYIKIDSLPKDCVFEEQIKAFQEGDSLYSQWLVSPMCYISTDKKYMELITEDDTIDSKILYYEMDSTN